MSARLPPLQATTQQELLKLGVSYNQHPLIEIELQPTAPACPDPLGARLEKSKSMPSHMANRSHSVECSNSVVENKDKPPGPARPLRFNKTIQLYGQYGYGV